MDAIEVLDWGRMPYDEAWERQHEIFDFKVEAKKRKVSPGADHLILVEHDPVVTLGKHAKESNVLFSRDMLEARGVACFEIERGGDVTYHGPGQLVVYPIIDLEQHRLGVHDYVHLLEETVIRTIARYGIEGERVEGASGVWIGKGTMHERKICAVGVKISRYITMHGLALNVNTDMSGFSLINPCGFVDKGVTSLALELGHNVDFEETKSILAEEFISLLRIPFQGKA